MSGEAWVPLHPAADGLEDARRDVLLQEGHAAALADLVAEEAAEKLPAVAAATSRMRLAWRAASTTIMMSVMPGMGSGTKDESTMETRKTPTMPKESSRWMSGCGTATARARLQYAAGCGLLGRGTAR